MNKYYGLIISLIAGLSTLIGYFFIYLRGNKDKIISIFMPFTSSIMITLSIIDLIPIGIHNLYIFSNLIKLLICIMFFFIGFFLTHIIRKKYNTDNSLYKTGIMSMIAIIIHNIPEGIATYALSSIDFKLGLLFSIAIIFHNIPEGITIAIPIYYSTNNKFKAFIYTFISGISEFIGALITMFFLYKYITNTILGILFCTISGIMIYIGFELIEINKNTKNNHIYFVIGSLFILLVELLLKI